MIVKEIDLSTGVISERGYTQYEIDGLSNIKLPTLGKEQLLASITVTTSSGKTFDGNETARNDMLSALSAGELLGETQTNWKLADNTVSLVTRDELREALSLAIKAKGRIVGAIE